MTITVDSTFQSNYVAAANAAVIPNKRAAAIAAIRTYAGTGWKFILQRNGTDVVRVLGSGQLPVVGTSIVITTANIAATELVATADLTTGTWTGLLVNSSGVALISGSAGASGTDFIVSASTAAGMTVQINSITFTLPASLDQTTTTATGPVGQTSSAWVSTFAEEFAAPLNSAIWQKGLWYGSFYGNDPFNVETTGSGGAAPNGYVWVNYDVNANNNSRLRIWPDINPNGKFYNTHFQTLGGFKQKYGYFEARMKLPRGQGCWPAFWLVDHDLAGVAQPEIDIMEAYSGGGFASYWSNAAFQPESWSVSTYTDSGNMANRTKFTTGPINEVRDFAQPTLDSQFNVYGLKWTAGGNFTWYFNGVQRGTTTFTALDKLDTYPLGLVLSLAYGSASNAPSSVNDVTGTPRGPANAFEIDYVRVWRAA